VAVDELQGGVRTAERSEQLTEVAVNAPILAAPAVLLVLAGAFGMPALAFAAAGLELLIVAAGLLVWWMPYLTGVAAPWATAGTGVTWAQLHARTYAHTVIVVPRIGDRPRPNLEHMILHGLMLGAAALTLAAAAGL
jgi:hypothetical protein